MDRLERQGGRLALPGLELVYVWNGFNIIGKSPRLVEAMLELVNEEKERLKTANGKCPEGEKFEYKDNSFVDMAARVVL